MSETTRIQELTKVIIFQNERYYNGIEDDESISDAEYDIIIEELRELNPSSKLLKDAGHKPLYGEKIKHLSLMGSLEKETDLKALWAWYQKIVVEAETMGVEERYLYLVMAPKIDGLAIRINYKDGILVEAATRGDGYEGTLATKNIKAIESIPNVLSDFSGELRGEIYMKKSIFAEVAVDKANPRNAAAGALNADDPEETKSKKLDFFCYDAIPDDRDFKTEAEKAKYVKASLGEIKYVPLVRINDFNHFKTMIENIENTKRHMLDYAIDGLVFSINGIEAQEEMGFTGKRPKAKMAFKFKAEQAETIVLLIDSQVGRTGVICPMGRVNPTHLDGSTVSNVTLHNWANVFNKKLGVGDKVLIEKAGDIIPSVVRVMESGGAPAEGPDACPACDHPTTWDEVNLWCTNPACPAQVTRMLHHFCETMGMLGVGESIVEKMSSLVKSPSGLFELSVEDIKSVTAGRKVAENVHHAIHSHKKVELSTFLAALGLSHLGRTTSKTIAKEFRSIRALMCIEESILIRKLENLDGIGELTSKSIGKALCEYGEEIHALLSHVTVVDVKDATGPLAGLSFCMTGTLSRNKKLIGKDISDAGGEIKSGVTKDLSYLVQADPESESGKSKKAKKFNENLISHKIEVISEEQLIEMLK